MEARGIRTAPAATTWSGIVVAVVVAVAVAGAACGGPKYPLCSGDDACNAEGHHGVCMAGKCVACREDSQCGKSERCTEGACEAIPGACDDERKCPGDQPCLKGRCATTAKPLPGAPTEPTECDDDHACKRAGDRCENGHCVAPARGGPGCDAFTAPRFDYESQTLSADAKSTLERLAKCIHAGSLKGARVLLTGHCDARGETEFNLSLGAERAEQVRKFLVGLGLPQDRTATSSRGKLDASGSDDAGWANDRRVDIEVR